MGDGANIGRGAYTGLITGSGLDMHPPHGKAIYMCIEATSMDDPWAWAGPEQPWPGPVCTWAIHTGLRPICTRVQARYWPYGLRPVYSLYEPTLHIRVYGLGYRPCIPRVYAYVHSRY